MDEVLALLLLWRCIEVDLSSLDEVLDVVRYFISGSDLLRELSFMEHSFTPEETED